MRESLRRVVNRQRFETNAAAFGSRRPRFLRQRVRDRMVYSFARELRGRCGDGGDLREWRKSNFKDCEADVETLTKKPPKIRRVVTRAIWVL